MTDPRYVLDSLSQDLTPKQQVLLVKLMEEASEVAKVCSKILRFGTHPVDTVRGAATTYNNMQLLEDEMDDLNDAHNAFLATMP